VVDPLACSAPGSGNLPLCPRQAPNGRRQDCGCQQLEGVRPSVRSPGRRHFPRPSCPPPPASLCAWRCSTAYVLWPAVSVMWMRNVTISIRLVSSIRRYGSSLPVTPLDGTSPGSPLAPLPQAVPPCTLWPGHSRLNAFDSGSWCPCESVRGAAYGCHACGGRPAVPGFPACAPRGDRWGPTALLRAPRRVSCTRFELRL
jgi:hypothetical protein